MDSPSEDKQWATKYLLDPLTAPEPSDETGPGSHFTSSVNRASSASRSVKGPSVTSSMKAPSASVYPTPPPSASPTQSSFHPSNPYAASSSYGHSRNSSANGRQQRKSPDQVGNGKGRRRGSSLGERFPGDMSHRPLDQLRKETKAANRSPHLRKTHIPGADSIDILDKSVFGGAYHHEGPYDATLLSRNMNVKYSPVDAVRSSNAEALKATPRENIKDSLDKHMPLQGTAVIPPGMHSLDGSEMRYEEGSDLMREEDAPGGAYKRWPGIKYLPEDYKGKGEPSFSIEKALKDDKLKSHRRILSDGNSYEMQSHSRQRSGSGNIADFTGRDNSISYSDFEGGMHRSNTTGRRVGEGLKRRWGSLRRNKNKTTEL